MPTKKSKLEMLTQAQFIAEVAKSENTTQTAVLDAINLLRNGTVTVLKQHKSFSLFKFAAFNIIEVKERKGRNPSTGEKLIVPAHDVLRIKPSETLKNAMKGIEDDKPKPKSK